MPVVLERLQLWGQLEHNRKGPNLLPDVFTGRFLVPAKEKKEVDFLGRHPAPQSSLQGPLSYVDACVCTKGGGQTEPR